MSDILAGLSRRVRDFEYRRATAPGIARLVEESAEGGDGADAILRLALADADESLVEGMDWTYGSASPQGQGAEVGQPAKMEEEQDPEEMFGAMSSFDMMGLADPDDDDPADDGTEMGEAGDEVGQFDLAEAGDALDALADGLGEEEAAASAPLAPGEAAVY